MGIQNITVIGAGNVGWHMAKTLYNKGYNIMQVFSRTIENTKEIVNFTNAQPINSLAQLNSNTDLIIICVSDKAIEAVANKINFEPKLIAHTAGSVSIDALKHFKNHGVFYPLQSFTKGIDTNFSDIPLCIEANTPENKNTLVELANSLSPVVYELNSEQRKQCHLAAVFANNFSNHMYHMAKQFLDKNQLPFDILKPLILETASKVQHTPPKLAQTGPAIRNDKNTMEEHLKLLSSPELEKLYSFVSESIWMNKKNS